VQRFKAILYAWLRRPPAAPRERSRDSFSGLRNDDCHGFNAHSIWFRDSMPYDHPGLPNHFPNQTIPVHDLLDDHNPFQSPIVEPCSEGTIRYFHFPANNMGWVEVSNRNQSRELYAKVNFKGSCSSILP
jgi:hypothetical protein